MEQTHNNVLRGATLDDCLRAEILRQTILHRSSDGCCLHRFLFDDGTKGEELVAALSVWEAAAVGHGECHEFGELVLRMDELQRKRVRTGFYAFAVVVR